MINAMTRKVTALFYRGSAATEAGAQEKTDEVPSDRASEGFEVGGCGFALKG
jgi:hypothetical protein